MKSSLLYTVAAFQPVDSVIKKNISLSEWRKVCPDVFLGCDDTSGAHDTWARVGIYVFHVNDTL